MVVSNICLFPSRSLGKWSNLTTPPKTNMEPENTPSEKEKVSETSSNHQCLMFGFHASFPGCYIFFRWVGKKPTNHQPENTAGQWCGSHVPLHGLWRNTSVRTDLPFRFFSIGEEWSERGLRSYIEIFLPWKLTVGTQKKWSFGRWFPYFPFSKQVIFQVSAVNFSRVYI